MKPAHLTALFTAIAATLPAFLLRQAGVHLEPQLAALTSGAAILGASFLLLWACDAAQTEISQGLALAIVALVSVLPEYSVDMYFAWQAGKNPAANYAQYAVANMTGANRLLIGVAWGLIAVLYWVRFRRPVRLEKDRRLELMFLGLATLWAFLIPIKGTLAWYDGVVLLGLYGAYIRAAAKRCCAECEAEGPAELITRLPKAGRRWATAAMFVFAAAVILMNAEAFCEGLLGTGRVLGVSEFVLVQWLAPIASEAPEFVVALMFAWRGQAGLALGSLLSAKLNQWTLLVGMIPGVYGVAHRGFDHAIPMGTLQMNEILLTAAQSLLGLMLLLGLRFSIGGAMLLFGLFFGQLILPVLVKSLPGAAFGLPPQYIHQAFTMLYLTTAVALAVQRPHLLLHFVRSASETPVLPPPEAHGEDSFKSPHCRNCAWRLAAQHPASETRPRPVVTGPPSHH